MSTRTGQQRIKSVRFDLPSLLEDIAQSIADQADKGDIEIICFIDPSTPVMVKGDPNRLHQLVMSLVGYAVKCANPGGVSIHTKAEKETKPYSRVVFSISFNGTTAFADHQQVIQEFLAGVDDSAIPEFSGIDSDLFVSQQLAKRMGSTIHVINIPEKESKVSFTIKFKRDTMITANEPAIELKGIRILLVDDNPTSLQALTKMLNTMGCRVKAVARGAEVHPAVVRGLITNSPFRVVLLDMEMPVMDGESVLRALRQDDLTRNTKVIVLTPIGKRKKLDSISTLGYSNYLFKPVRRSELSEVLESTLGLREGNQPRKNLMKTDEAADTRGVQSLKVLLVEDNEANQKIGAILLDHLGCTVETAFSGAEAVAAVETRDYDLVFMDVQMPEMSGLEATRRIRAIKNDRKNVPIIAMTAHDVTLYEQRCHEAGMDDFISKPFNIQHIAEIIKACTEGKYGKGLKPVITPEPMTLPVEALLLDVAVGMLVFDNDAVRYDNFLKEFMEGLPKRLEKMTIALNAEAWELLGNEAHNLKGISANLGAGKISNRASQLEAQSRERTEEPAHSTLREIEDAISELMEQAPHIISMLLKSSNNKRDT